MKRTPGGQLREADSKGKKRRHAISFEIRAAEVHSRTDGKVIGWAVCGHGWADAVIFSTSSLEQHNAGRGSCPPACDELFGSAAENGNSEGTHIDCLVSKRSGRTTTGRRVVGS